MASSVATSDGLAAGVAGLFVLFMLVDGGCGVGGGCGGGGGGRGGGGVWLEGRHIGWIGRGRRGLVRVVHVGGRRLRRRRGLRRGGRLRLWSCLRPNWFRHRRDVAGEQDEATAQDERTQARGQTFHENSPEDLR